VSDPFSSDPISPDLTASNSVSSDLAFSGRGQSRGQSPAEALARRAAADPQDPWLFHRPALDWRWCSWSWVSRAVAAVEFELADVPAGTRVGLADTLHPNSIAWCFALQSRGLVAVPLPEAELRESPEVTLREAGCSLWVDGEEGSAGSKPLGKGGERILLPSIPGPFEKKPSRGADPASLSRPGREGAVVLRCAGELEEEGANEKLPFGELLARAESSFQGLAPASARDIVVVTGSLADLAVQEVLAWSLRSAAALLLEPTASAYGPTVEWARPTILAGTAEVLAGLHDRLAPRPAPRPKFWHRRPRGPLAKPLDRLRAVAVLGGGEPDERGAAMWRELGIPLLGA